MLSDSSKATIDALSLGELRHEFALGNRSRFQGEKFDYVKVRLAEREREREEINDEREKSAAPKKEGSWVSRHTNALIGAGATIGAALIYVLFVNVDPYSSGEGATDPPPITEPKTDSGDSTVTDRDNAVAKLEAMLIAATSLQFPSDRDQGLRDIISYSIQSDIPDAAVKVVPELQFPSDQDTEYELLIDALIGLGKYEDAVEAILLLQFPSDRDDAMKRLLAAKPGNAN